MTDKTPVFPLPKEGELIAFPHGAAGHQGITSTAAGDLIIKPCTQAEIDFYEAAKKHPEFQAHMPVYMGKLELGNKTAIQALSPVAEQGPSVSPAAPKAEVVAGEKTEVETGEKTEVEAGEKAAPTSQEQPTSQQSKTNTETKAWIPSGGKKLSTGLAIVLENAAASFKKPNVIDLKLGSRLWADDAVEAKRDKLDQVAKETTSGSLGFRVAGAKIWLGDSARHAEKEVNTEIKDGYKSYNKNYGRGLDEQSVQTAMARFLSGTTNPTIKGRDKTWLGSDEARTLTQRLIREVESIEYVLEHEESRMYSASILIVIEGDYKALQEAMEFEKKKEETAEKIADREAKDAAEENKEVEKDDGDDEDEDEDDESVIEPKVMEVRLIDFAHAQFTPGQGPDENALKGVRSILEILREIGK